MQIHNQPDSRSSGIKTFPCETCGWRRKAEAKPDALLARLWRWHTRWCPGWKKYQAHLTTLNQT